MQRGTDIRTIQQLLGHSDVRTTMIYTHVLQQGGYGVTLGNMFQFTVIPGAAERRSGHEVKLFSAIQSAAETLWIPAFAGMTEKNSITKIQTVKNAPCVKCVKRPA